MPHISIALKTAVNAITSYSPFFLNHAREFVFHADDYKLLDLGENPSDDHLKIRSDFIKKFLNIINDCVCDMLAAIYCETFPIYLC